MKYGAAQIWHTSHIPLHFHLTTHFQAHPRCLPLSSLVAAVGECACAIVRRKRGLVAATKCLQAEGRRIQDAMEKLRVCGQSLDLGITGEGVRKPDHLDKILRSKKKAALTGPVGQLKAIEDALLH